MNIEVRRRSVKGPCKQVPAAVLRLLGWRGKSLNEWLQLSIGGSCNEPVCVNRSVATALRWVQ